MAFVVITHQAPDRTTLLPELLAKHAEIPVTTAADGMPLRPDHVYVAPPGRALIIKDETLRLSTLEPARGALTIDHAFRALAENEGDHGIGIVLSGNGSDGTLGIVEIKGAFGMVMAQDPRTAQYPGMPASAIATHLVDFVLPPEEMPAQLVRYVRGQRRMVRDRFRFEDAGVDGALHKILAVLRGRNGSDFSAYKKSTMRRRIERRMHVHGITEPEEYARFLEHTAYEVDALFKELLISVTSFFRDPPAFEALEHELSKLVELKDDGQTLRAWITGCATGEEAYSIAIVVKEVLQRAHKNIKVQIFATDLDQAAVDVARGGRYPDGIAADVSPERLDRFFTREDSGYRVNKDVRELIVFAVQNVIKDPPFTKVDLLSCRNLLIYLESELQKRVLGLFSYALLPHGLLLLGTSESVTGFDDRFSTLDKRWKLFQRSENAAMQTLPDFFGERAATTAVGGGHPLARDGHRGRPGIAAVAERVLLSSFVPPSIIISERGELIYVQGRIGAYFELAPGEPTQNVFTMAREGLRAELPAAIRAAATMNRSVVRRNLQVKTNGGYSPVTLTARRLSEPEALRNAFVISFMTGNELEDPPATKKGRKPGKSVERISAVEEEPQRTRENLQGMIEELETTNEELQSTNEELQSTNEELQSANEELETSREEMQSLNEELQTVNAELEGRNRALSQANDDMQNLLNSTDIATVFLDEQLHIKRFTTQAKKVFSLIETDIGRPIADLAANLRYDKLVDEAQEVLNTLVFREREIQTKDGQWRLMRIMPYRTYENLIDGLVMTFVDIDRLKRAQRSEKETRAYAEDVMDALDVGVLVLDVGQRVISANHAFCEMFASEPRRLVGQTLPHLAGGVVDLSKVVERFDELLKRRDGTPLDFGSVTARTGGARVTAKARRIHDYPERPELVMVLFEPTP